MARSYLVGLIGEGITASLTPPMHETEAATLGIPYEYRVLDLLELDRAPTEVGAMVDEARRAGFDALNITHPCKQLVIASVDELDPHAEALQAVNLVVLDGDRVRGYNTDWTGFRDALAEGLPTEGSLRRVVQIGCGGAGSATAYALLVSGVEELELSDADPHRAGELAARMRAHFPEQRVSTIAHERLLAVIPDATGVVNATPMGMAHHPGVAFDVAMLDSAAWVADVVYRPLRTELIDRAEERGHLVLDGGRMAVGQAYASLEIITGRRPDRARMQEHFRELVRRESHGTA